MFSSTSLWTARDPCATHHRDDEEENHKEDNKLSHPCRSLLPKSVVECEQSKHDWKANAQHSACMRLVFDCVCVCARRWPRAIIVGTLLVQIKKKTSSFINCKRRNIGCCPYDFHSQPLRSHCIASATESTSRWNKPIVFNVRSKALEYEKRKWFINQRRSHLAHAQVHRHWHTIIAQYSLRHMKNGFRVESEWWCTASRENELRP